MRYPNKLYIRMLKNPAMKKNGISAGQSLFIKNFIMTKFVVARRSIEQKQKRDRHSGVEYKAGQLADYKDIFELELIRKDLWLKK